MTPSFSSRKVILSIVIPAKAGIHFLIPFFFLLFFPTLSRADITTGLVGHWKFDEMSGLTAKDTSGSNNGTLNNGPTWEQGKRGGALGFNSGSSQYVSIPDHASNRFGTGDFTLSIWIKTTTSANEVFIGKYNGDANNEYYMNIDSGVIAFEISSSRVNSGAVLGNDDRWHHIVGLRNLGTTYLFIDGREIASGSNTGNADSSGYLGIGRFGVGASFLFDGLIDDVRIYNGALTADDVAELYGRSTIRNAHIANAAKGN